MYVCLYVCLWRLGSGSLALPAGIGADLPSTLPAPAKVSRLRSQRLGSGSLALPAGVAPDLPSTLPAPAKVSRHQSHTPAPPASPISRNSKVKHCRCLKLDATGVTEALATTTRILLMPHRPRGRRPAEHHSQTNKRLANITFQQRGGVPRTPATANARKGPKTMTCHSEAPRGRQAPQQGVPPSLVEDGPPSQRRPPPRTRSAATNGGTFRDRWCPSPRGAVVHERTRRSPRPDSHTHTHTYTRTHTSTHINI